MCVLVELLVAVEVGETVEIALMTVTNTVMVEELGEEVGIAAVEVEMLAALLAVETGELPRSGKIVHSIEIVCVIDMAMLLSV